MPVQPVPLPSKEQRKERLAEKFMEANEWTAEERSTLGPAGKLVLGILIDGGDDYQSLSVLISTFGDYSTGRAKLRDNFTKGMQSLRKVFREHGEREGEETSHTFKFYYPSRSIRRATLAKNGDTDLIRLSLSRTMRQQVSRLAGIDSSPLLGRHHQEVATKLEQTVRDVSRQVVWLHGMSGVGKTSVLDEVHSAMTKDGRFEAGVRVADLGGVNGLEEAWREVAESILTPDESKELAAVEAYLHHNDVLLILDRLEAVTGGEKMGKHLAEVASPKTRIIVASQLPPPAEADWCEVFPLTGIPSAYAADRISLFSFYASRYKNADLRFSTEEQNTIRRVCELLGGNPLLIRMAASRLVDITLNDLVSILQVPGTRLTEMVLQDSSLPTRQRSELSLLENIFGGLNTPTRHLLSQLLFFPDGFTPSAAQAVYQAEQLRAEDLHAFSDAWRLLRDRNWIEEVPRHDAGPRRYRIPDMVRAFVTERVIDLSKELLPRTQTQHRHYYLSLTQRKFSEEATPNQGYVFDELEAERINIELCLGRPEQDNLSGLEIATSLQHFWFVRGYLRRGSEYLSAALEHHPQRDALRAQALISLAWLVFWQGGISDATNYFQESREISQDLLNTSTDQRDRKTHEQRSAVAVIGIGQAYAYQRRYGEAQELLEQGSLVGSDWRWEAVALNYLGMNEMYRGDAASDDELQREVCYRRSRRYHMQSLEIRRGQEHHLGVAVCLNRLVLLDLREGRIEEAEWNTAESLKTHRELSCVPGMIDCLESQARITFRRGNVFRAARNSIVAKLARKEHGFSVLPAEREEVDRFETNLEDSFADRTDWAEVQRECRRMSLTEAAEEAFTSLSMSAGRV